MSHGKKILDSTAKQSLSMWIQRPLGQTIQTKRILYLDVSWL